MAPKIEHTEENYDRLVGDAASLTALRASLRDQGEYDPEILGDRSLDDWREFAKETTITLWQHSTNGFRGAFFELLNLHPDMAADKDNPEGGKLHPFMPYDYVDYEGEWRLPIAMLLAGMSEAIEVGPDNDGGMTDFVWEDDDELEPGPVGKAWGWVWGEAADLGKTILDTSEKVAEKTAAPAESLASAVKWAVAGLGLVAAIVIVPRVLPAKR